MSRPKFGGWRGGWLSIVLGASAAHGLPAASSRLLAPDWVPVLHNLDNEYFVEGPGLVKIGDGQLLATVPILPRGEWHNARKAEFSRIKILRSADAGRTWTQVSELPYYSAAPWNHGGSLYLFVTKGGTKHRNDDLLLLRSRDGGRTWSAPVTLFKGHVWNVPTGMVIRDNRLYWAVDDLSFGLSGRGPRVVVGDLSRDPMEPAAWRLSNPVPLAVVPEQIANPAFAHFSSRYLEPNVIDVQGRIRVLAAFKPKRMSTSGMAAVFDFTENAGEPELKFSQYNPMPGGQLKFCILKDPASGMFWAAGNLVVDSQSQFDHWWSVFRERPGFHSNDPIGGNDRRFLMLFYSLDGLSWFQAGCVAQARKLSQSFMYPSLLIDGPDLAIIARSSINAPNHHDADYATFHRVRNFRELALNLVPEPESR
jgi:hypothetical protein